MAENSTAKNDKTISKTMPEDVEQNAGMRAVAIDSNPKISLEEARNAAEGKAPNASGGSAPSDTENHVPSTSDPEGTDLPTANAPNPV